MPEGTAYRWNRYFLVDIFKEYHYKYYIRDAMKKETLTEQFRKQLNEFDWKIWRRISKTNQETLDSLYAKMLAAKTEEEKDRYAGQLVDKAFS